MIRFTLLPGRQTLTILTFHRVLDEPHPLYPEWPTQRAFQQKLRWLKSCAEIVPLAQGLDRIRDGSGSRHLAAVTFDDGYKDNLDLALPVLQAENVHCTFFVATRYIEQGLLFDDLVVRAFTHTKCKSFQEPRLGMPERSIESVGDRRKVADHLLEKLKYLPPVERDRIAADVANQLSLQDRESPMLRIDGLRELRDAGMEIGSHSYEHPISNTLSDPEFISDTTRSVEMLVQMLDVRPRFFAFPNGILGKDFAPRHSVILEEMGFEAAFSTSPGVVRPASNFFALPRMTPWPRTRLRFMAEVLLGRSIL